MSVLDDLLETHKKLEKDIKEIKSLIVSNDEEEVSSNYQLLLFEQYHTMEVLSTILFRRIQIEASKNTKSKNGENQNGK